MKSEYIFFVGCWYWEVCLKILSSLLSIAYPARIVPLYFEEVLRVAASTFLWALPKHLTATDGGNVDKCKEHFSALFWKLTAALSTSGY
ncbi:hypothetical protein FM037_06520 [Shewanella psychropiezotolerans]|uniref:Uncharacterized protein n=1 Tax=Shewanella psychropiezotolerans TaxID=2593655 RepID=A0ABX5WV26_9GAMM|nr:MULTISPECIES: hypothetical protein [Shewanella]MPY22780.1 hypothetical protein [Shewanella sp. YLB-07]QDO82944.1 hypothetical protein FM037_06520 [Shewanella psychropiezotolerans]